MNYLLDNHSLSAEILDLVRSRSDICVIQDVVDDEVQSDLERKKIHSSGIRILRVGKKHLERLISLLEEIGDNLNLIRLYLGEGTADVIMLAYILAEKESQSDRLFPEEWAIVTEDKELTSVATHYKIPSFTKEQFLKNTGAAEVNPPQGTRAE